MEPLDQSDLRLLRLLQEDARRPFKELAHSVALATSTVYERVRRLRATGVLLGTHAEVTPAALGLRLQAMVFVQLNQHSGQALEAFAVGMAQREWVRDVYHLAGRQDFALHVVARDTESLRAQVMEVTELAEVRQVETNLIFEHRRNHVLPDSSTPKAPAR
ncbi:MAG: Lrp/AsnC family transcriptional regulator [Myxococcota bacterium]|nr:Lrp/AsnC family transcriptional regulator [Myxococcota bacterium]